MVVPGKQDPKSKIKIMDNHMRDECEARYREPCPPLPREVKPRKPYIPPEYMPPDEREFLEEKQPEKPVEKKQPAGEPSHLELIRGILEQHETFRQIFEEIQKVVRSLATAPKPKEKYYDSPQTVISVATAAQPNSPDIISNPTAGTSGYQAETIYATLQRIAPKVTVINDGTATLFVISTPDGTNWSSEAPILIGEARTFYNVWELRLRSPTAGALGPPTSGGVYRVTERDFWLAYSNAVSSTFLTPKVQATQTGFALPAINTGWLASLGLPVLTPTSTPTLFRIMVAVSIAGIFKANIFVGGVAIPVPLAFNAIAGPALVPDSLYIFNMLLHAGDTVDFSYSTTGGTVRIFRVEEIDAAIAG